MNKGFVFLFFLCNQDKAVRSGASASIEQRVCIFCLRIFVDVRGSFSDSGTGSSSARVASLNKGFVFLVFVCHQGNMVRSGASAAIEQRVCIFLSSDFCLRAWQGTGLQASCIEPWHRKTAGVAFRGFPRSPPDPIPKLAQIAPKLDPSWFKLAPESSFRATHKSNKNVLCIWPLKRHQTGPKLAPSWP